MSTDCGQIEYERGDYAPAPPEVTEVTPGNLSGVSGKNIIEIDGTGATDIHLLPSSGYADGATLIIRPADEETDITFHDYTEEGYTDGNIDLPDGKDTPQLTHPSHQAKFIYNAETGKWLLNSANVMVLAVEDLEAIVEDVSGVDVGITEIPMTITYTLTPPPSVAGAIAVPEAIPMTMAFALTPAPTVKSGFTGQYSISAGVANFAEGIFTYPGGTNVITLNVKGSMIHKHQDNNSAYSVFQDSMFPFHTNTQGNNVADQAWYGILYNPGTPGATPPGNTRNFLLWYVFNGPSVNTSPWEMMLYEGVGTIRQIYTKLDTTQAVADMCIVDDEHSCPAVHFNEDIGWIPLSLIKPLSKATPWTQAPKQIESGTLPNLSISYEFDGPGWTGNPAPTTTKLDSQVKNMAQAWGTTINEVRTELEALRDGGSPDLSKIRNFCPYSIEINMTAIEQNLGVGSSGRTGDMKFAVIGADKDPSGTLLSGSDNPLDAWGEYDIEFTV